MIRASLAGMLLLATVPGTTPASTAPASTTPIAPAAPALDDVQTIVATLASDQMAGRDNATEGSRLAREYLARQLSAVANPVFPFSAGNDRFFYTFSAESGVEGVNIVGIIPGTDLANQYVVIGAHYDHVGSACRGASAADQVCNGAADNAAGVAAVLHAAKAIAADPTRRRSVLVALWDAEEDGLVGSAEYLRKPLIPVTDTVAYVNADILGSTLTPTLREDTLMIGAETGGERLTQMAGDAARGSTLTTRTLSLIFGQGRSDHANFVNAGVPSVFFTDGPGGCYHTVDDTAATIDSAKLDQQAGTLARVAGALVHNDRRPVFNPGAPLATVSDAQEMLGLMNRAADDLTKVSPDQADTVRNYIAALEAMTAGEPTVLEPDEIGLLLGGAQQLLEILATLPCP